MATRINTRFVLILSIVVMTAGGIIGGLWVLQLRNDTSRHIRKGDAMVAEAQALDAAGDDAGASVIFEKAINEYGRAVNKEQSNLSHLQKLQAALLQLRPMTQDQAREFDDMRIGVLRREVRYKPQDAAAHLELVRELHRVARWSDDAWQLVADAGDEMIRDLSPGDPDRVYGRLYRGMAKMHQYGYGGTNIAGRSATQEEIDASMADIKAFVQARPEVDLGQATLLEMQLGLARQLQAEGSQRAADDAFAELEDSVAAALEAVPDGPEVSRIVALRLALEYLAGDRQADDPELTAAVNRMVELVAPTDDPMLLADASRLLRIADRENGLSRAIEMMQTYVEEHPEAYYQRFALAGLYYAARDLDQARKECRAVIDARPVRVSLLARILPNLRIQAAGMIVDCQYLLWQQADEADKPAQLAKAEAARNALAAMVADPEKEPLLLKADGKIAAARNDNATAAAKFERFIELVPSPDVEVLWSSARALEQIDQLGLARKRLADAAELQPQNVVLLADKARLEFGVGLYDDFRETAGKVLALDPGNTTVNRLMTAMDTTQAGQAGQGGDVATTAAGRTLLAAGAALAEDNTDGAREILLAALPDASDRLPILTELVHVELRAGRTDEARKYVAEALKIQPLNTYLRKLQIGLNNEDQIEALKEYMAEEYPDEADRVVNTFIHLEAMAMELDHIADSFDKTGKTEKAEGARDRAEVARQEAAAMRVRAEQIAPGNQTFLGYLFNEALQNQDWDTMESIVATARANDSDLAGGRIFEGRYALARDNYDKAIQVLTEATDRKRYSATAWRLLGRAHERKGNFTEALAAYEQSYACNPNDQMVIRWYANLLLQTGGRDRALRILRAAQHTVPNDALLRDARLDLEAQIGDVGVAMRERSRQYAVNPGDRTNAIRLAGLLARTEPTQRLIVGLDGKLAYTAEAWQLLPETERKKVIQETAAQWVSRSEAILAKIEAGGDDSVELASVKSNLLMARGLIDEGEAALVAYRDRHKDDIAAHLALAAYQRKAEHNQDALDTLEAAVPYQSAEKHEADMARADLYFELGQWPRAAELYESVVAIRPEAGVQLRLVECYTKLNRNDDADSLLKQVVAADGEDFYTAMLRASIADGQADALAAAGQATKAAQRDAEAAAALDQAERLMPNSPMPHIRRAQRLLKKYQSTEQLSLLDDALRDLDRADRAQAGNEATSRIRVEVFRAKNDDRSAIGELTRLVQRAPDNLWARRLLVQMLAESGNLNGAMEVVRAAIARNPSIGMWHDALGDLYVQRSTAAESESAARVEAGNAAKAFRESFRLQPSAPRLAKYAELALRVDDPDYKSVTGLIEESSNLLEGSPLLRGLYAAALTGEGRHDEALEQMRLAWGEHQEILQLQPDERRALVSWYRMLQVVLTDEDPARYEQFVREVSGGEPSPLGLVWAARTWAAARTHEATTHALELLDTASARCSADDKEVRGLIGLDRGQYYVTLGQYREAAESFEDVIELAAADPEVGDHALALNNAAYLYAEHLNDPEKAAEYARRANDVKPNDASILDTLGWSLFKLKRYDEAQDALRQSMDAGKSPENFLHLAWVLYKTDQPDTARNYLMAAESMQPGPATKAQIDELRQNLRQ